MPVRHGISKHILTSEGRLPNRIARLDKIKFDWTFDPLFEGCTVQPSERVPAKLKHPYCFSNFCWTTIEPNVAGGNRAEI